MEVGITPSKLDDCKFRNSNLNFEYEWKLRSTTTVRLFGPRSRLVRFNLFMKLTNKTVPPIEFPETLTIVRLWRFARQLGMVPVMLIIHKRNFSKGKHLTD